MLIYRKGVDWDDISYGWVQVADDFDTWEDYSQSYEAPFQDLNIPLDEDSNFYSSLHQTEEFQTCGVLRVSLHLSERKRGILSCIR